MAEPRIVETAVFIRPGDIVLLPILAAHVSQAEVAHAKTTLEDQFPGVTFQFVGSTMHHALVYRTPPVPGGARPREGSTMPLR